MRVLITADPMIPVPPQNYGGIERIIDFLTTGLVRRGHEVALVAHAESSPNAKLFSYTPQANNLLSHVKNIATIAGTRSFKPDVVHSFSRLAYLAPYLLSAVPKIMSYQREPTIKQIKKIMKLSRKDTMSFTGCSNYITDQIRPYAPAYTVYNGVDLNIYDLAANVPPNAPLIFLGRIEPIKGTDIAIEIARKTGRELIIAGNIPTGAGNYFQSRIKPQLDDQIRYVGPVNDAEKNVLLQKASAFLMPIQWNEPFGIVMCEAMACGTPVIGFNRGAVPEVVDEKTGFVCNTTNEMIEAVKRSGDLDRTGVRSRCAERFSADTIIDNYVHMYKERLR